MVPNDMAQWRDVHGEQYWAQHRTLRYTILQHRRLGRPASSQHYLVTFSQISVTRAIAALHQICQSSALVSLAVYCDVLFHPCRSFGY